MATLIEYGAVPEWGIKHAEDAALLVTSLDITTTASGKYEQKNHLGQTSGVILYDQQKSWSMSGAQLKGAKLTTTLAAAVVLNNFEGNEDFVDGLGAGAEKSEQTAICEEIKRTFGNESAVQLDLSGTVYNFGAGV